MSYLPEQPQHAKAAIVDAELRRARKTAQAVGEGVEDVEEVLRHS